MKRLLAIAFALALVAAACGGDDGDDPAESPTVPFAEVTEDARGLATRTPGEATAIAGDYAIVTYVHEAAPRREGTDIIDFTYEVPVPEGWVISGQGVTTTAELPGPNNFPYVTITVDCRPGVNALEMLDVDARAASQLGIGNLAGAPTSAGQVGERDATLVRWRGGGLFPADRLSAYVDGKDCAWRLQLNTLGSIQVGEMEPVFQEILARFNPDQGLPAGFVPLR